MYKSNSQTNCCQPSDELEPAVAAKPRQPAPALEVAIAGGGRWSLRDSKPERFTLIVAYRSLHCPICKGYLGELETKLPEFARRGVEVIAVSVDTAERAMRAKTEWRLKTLRVGYELPLATARDWGLFVSAAQKESEPAHFTEPGLFLVKPDGTLFSASISSTPWARPPFGEMLRAIDFFVQHDPPARGEA
jgi:peroxiredoxin